MVMAYMNHVLIGAAKNGAIMIVKIIQVDVQHILELQTITDIVLILIYKMQHIRLQIWVGIIQR